MKSWILASVLFWALPASAQAPVSAWRDVPLPEAAPACQTLPSFTALLAPYYTALRADDQDAINRQALRDLSALAVRHGQVNQAARLYADHVRHNGGRAASTAVTKALVNTYLDADRRDALIALLFAPLGLDGRALAELKFMIAFGLAERGQAWIVYDLQNRNPGLMDDIDLDLALYFGALRAQNPILIDRLAALVALSELQAYDAGLRADLRAFFDYAALPQARRNRAIAAFAYALTLHPTSPPFDQLVLPLTEASTPALIANIFARMGRPNWAVQTLAAANTIPQFAGRAMGDASLVDELVRLAADVTLIDLYEQSYVRPSAALAVSLARSGRYAQAQEVLERLDANDIRPVNPLLALALIANGHGSNPPEAWQMDGDRMEQLANLTQFEPAFMGDDAVFSTFLRQVDRSAHLSRDQIDTSLNLLTYMLEREGRYDRAADVLVRIQSPDLRLRAANSLAQAISHRCYGGLETLSPFYPFTLGDADLDGHYRHRTLRVF